MIKKLFIVCLFSTQILLNGCSGSLDSSEIRIEIIKPVDDTTPQVTGEVEIQSTTPTSLAGLDCIGVMAGHIDGSDNRGNCQDTSGNDIPVASWDGLKTYSSSSVTGLTLSGLKSKEARITLVGFKKPATYTSCDKIDRDFSPEDDGYSDPYIIGSKDLALAAGNNATTINASFNSSLQIDDCDDTIWDQGGGLENGLLAFWNFDRSSVEATDEIAVDSKGSNNLNWTGAENLSTPAAKIGGARDTSTSAGPVYNHISSTRGCPPSRWNLFEPRIVFPS